MSTKLTTVLLVVCAMAWTGCEHYAPRGEGGDGLSRSDVLDMEKLAHDVWKLDKRLDYDLPRQPRVAIVEFTLEYVHDREDSDFGSGMKLELPGVLYHGFVQTLPQFHRHPIALQTVSDAAAYQELRGTRMAQIVPAAAKKEDDGTRYTVHGLLDLNDGQNHGAAIRKVMEEVEADVALQVHLRVGVRDGRASIEKGSTFRVIAPTADAVATSKMTIVSSEGVVAEDEDDGARAIDSRLFVRAVQRLFRPYISLVLIASGRSLDES